MALSDTIGKSLEVFASKTAAETTAEEFAAAHPGAISFTTDGKIVFGGVEYGGGGATTTDTITIGGEIGSKVLGDRRSLNNFISTVCENIGRCIMQTVPDSSLSSILPSVVGDGEARLGSIIDGLSSAISSIPANNVNVGGIGNPSYGYGLLGSVLADIVNRSERINIYYANTGLDNLGTVLDYFTNTTSEGTTQLGTALECISKVLVNHIPASCNLGSGIIGASNNELASMGLTANSALSDFCLTIGSQVVVNQTANTKKPTVYNESNVGFGDAGWGFSHLTFEALRPGDVLFDGAGFGIVTRLVPASGGNDVVILAFADGLIRYQTAQVDGNWVNHALYSFSPQLI